MYITYIYIYIYLYIYIYIYLFMRVAYIYTHKYTYIETILLESFLIKVAGLLPTFLLNKTLWHKYFSVIFFFNFS